MTGVKQLVCHETAKYLAKYLLAITSYHRTGLHFGCLFQNVVVCIHFYRNKKEKKNVKVQNKQLESCVLVSSESPILDK